MATNDNTNPGTEGDQVINGTTGADTLTGALGADTITGGSGDDVLSGDGPVEGACSTRPITSISILAQDKHLILRVSVLIKRFLAPRHGLL